MSPSVDRHLESHCDIINLEDIEDDRIFYEYNKILMIKNHIQCKRLCHYAIFVLSITTPYEVMVEFVQKIIDCCCKAIQHSILTMYKVTGQAVEW